MGKVVAEYCHAFLSAPLIFAVLLLFTGCKDETQEAWEVAYRAQYNDSYQAALEIGKARGGLEGKEQGVAAAREAAKDGRAWQLYSTMACWALVPGILAGIVVQYAILFTCQTNGRLPGPATWAFVPGMKKSFCYLIFERRLRLMVELDEQLQKTDAAKNLKLAQVQAVHDAVKRQVMAASSLEELTQARLVELANIEFATIVAEAERINQVQISQRSETKHRRNACACPHCGRRLQFPRKAASTTINCPHSNCGRPIRLPPLQSS